LSEHRFGPIGRFGVSGACPRQPIARVFDD
jgi:hypothetical protein